MKLKRIKLAGFKSFADNTAITFRGNCIAIVGPNGCGKSNIIDAIRWVMGESSAKQLRGELLEDVIFNGTANRKPVGQATIELHFDNSINPIVGEYAKYNEILIRRELNRDGSSLYYFNGTRCRRKDIIDIFLGTGLSPRSYSIIEQGMISQLIEAKPDDLRSYIEEAAGISKYKERRKETEHRMQATKENIVRLNDIQNELEKQLQHLRHQANAANRYKDYKEKQRLLKAQLQILYWQALEQQQLILKDEISKSENALEAKKAENSKLQSLIEQQRQQTFAARDELSNVQKHYYDLAGQISRLEEQINSRKERLAQLKQDLSKIINNHQQVLLHTETDKAKLTELTKKLQLLVTNQETAKIDLKNAHTEFATAEQKVVEWQTKLNEHNQILEQNLKQLAVSNTTLLHLTENQNQLHEKLAKLLAEQEELEDFNAISEELGELENSCNDIAHLRDQLKEKLAAKRAQIVTDRSAILQLQNNLDTKRSQLRQLQGKYASLESLQNEALHKGEQDLQAWLKNHNLAEKPKLLQEINVESGFEKAVETVLQPYLNAIYFDTTDPTELTKILPTLAHGNLMVYFDDQETDPSNVKTLASKIKSKIKIPNIFNHIHIANTLEEAMQIRQSLQAHESVITKDGIWISKDFIFFDSGKDAKSGILQRKNVLNDLAEQIQKLENDVQQENNKLLEARENLHELETECTQIEKELDEENVRHSALHSELQAKKSNLSHLQKRADILANEIEDIKKRLDATNQQLTTTRESLQQLEEQKITNSSEHQRLLAVGQELQKQFQIIKETSQKLQRTFDENEAQRRIISNEIEILHKNLARFETQLSEFTTLQKEIAENINLAERPIPALNLELENSLNNKIQLNQQLENATKAVNTIENDLDTNQKQQQVLINEEAAIRSELEQNKLKALELETKKQNHVERVTETGFAFDEVANTLPDDLTSEILEEKIVRLDKKIEQLGLINLAAVDEFQQKQEQKTYLDAQHKDLQEALNTLDEAIRKIDRETKEQFKETFAKIDTEFQRLFPIIFNGGKASLLMTGDDLLSTGVNIMAQPPGKRNATIHLLSGGEKALTAVALIFAIFQLNPSPFCILDEVDAPLDDNNVIRFTNLVKEMSQNVQFIFVSHNKITMEMADQLTGITMSEPGVSKVIAVDMVEALKMVENNN
jgi:chromosome segregation protein